LDHDEFAKPEFEDSFLKKDKLLSFFCTNFKLTEKAKRLFMNQQLAVCD